MVDGENGSASEVNENFTEIWEHLNILSGIVMTAGESITVTTPLPVYISPSDSKVYGCDDTNVAKLKFKAMVLTSMVINEAVTVYPMGVVDGFSNLAIGEFYCLKKNASTIIDPNQKNISTSSVGYIELGRTDRHEIGQVITTSSIYRLVKKKSFKLYKIGSPADNVVCKIYAADKTTLIATSTNVIAGSSLSTNTSGQVVDFTFNDVVLQSGTSYFIKLQRSGSYDNSNYYLAIRVNGASYSGGDGYFLSNDNVTWITMSGDDLYFTTDIREPNTSGDIAPTPGTNYVKIGQAISATKLEIHNKESHLGDYITLDINTNYLAIHDGFVMAYGTANSGSFTIFSDATATPTTTIIKSFHLANMIAPLIAPIKKGNYWRVEKAGDATTVIKFIPLS